MLNKSLFSFIVILIILGIFYWILYSCTNFSKWDDLDDYAKKYSPSTTHFSNINIGIKIMPSYNTAKNILYMQSSTDKTRSIIENSESIADSYEIAPVFFRLNHTNKVFPKLKNTKDNIPVGDSVTMCIDINWGLKERGLNYDIMRDVKGFPSCRQAETGKFIWNDDDPTTGVDVPVWLQSIHEADCSDEECDQFCEEKFNGLFVNGLKRHVCYSYEILDRICLVIEYDELSNSYLYKGGCFKNGEAYLMKKGEINEVHYFSGVEIEIREANDPVIKAGELSNYTYSFGSGWRYVVWVLNVILILAILGLCACIGIIVYYKIKYLKKPWVEHEEGHEDP